MRKRFLSVLLTLCMVLTLLPLASFAADEENSTAPTVAGYGFVWEADKYKKNAADGTTLTGGFYAGDDWMGETAYVVVGDSTVADINLWFELTVGDDTWGCAATTSGTANMFAFSFLNRGTQWEQHPTINGENFDYSGTNVTHATKYLADKNVDSITLKVYQTTTLFSDTSHDTTGLTPFFIREIAVTADTDTMKTVPDTIEEVQLALDTSGIAADTAVDDLPPATVKSVKLTDEGTAITTGTDTYVSVETKWYKEDGTTELTTSDTLAENQKIKYTITVTAKSSSEAAYALAANAVKVTNVADATVSGNVASGTFTVPAAAEKYTIKFAAGDGASGTMTEEKVAKAGSGAATTYTTPTTHTFTAPTDKTFDKWTVNEITGVTISEDGKTLTIGENVAVSEVITLTATWKTTVDPDALTVEFGKVTEQTDLYGKTPGDLGVFDIKTGTGADSHKITVTGSANYISGYVGFSSVTDERNGHYLPINIAVSKAAKVTITGSGEAKEVNLTEGDKTIQLVMRLDKIAALTDSTKNTFTVAVEGDTTPYTVDVSGVALLPDVVKDEETGVSESTVTKDDNLDKLIAETETTGDNTPAQAPVKVEVDGGNKTLTFDGTFNGTSTGDTSNKGHKVTLPQELATAMGSAGASKADVKVNSGVGSVTIPSAALTGVSDAVTVSIKEASKTVTGTAEIKDEAGVTLTTDEISAITTAISNASNGVSVEATTNSADLITGSTNTVTVVIKGMDKTKTYTVLCVSGNKVTSFGKYTPDEDGNIIIGTTHLTEWYPIDDSAVDTATQNALAKVAADGGKATPPTSGSINITFDGTSAATTGLTKATVTGLTGSRTVTVQVAKAADTAPAVVFTMTANASGEVEFSVNKGSEVTVWDGTVTFTNGVPVAPPNSATATAN